MAASQLSDILNIPMVSIALVGKDNVFLKCTQREKNHIVEHNNVFPRGIGMPQWVLGKDCTQMLILDKRLDDIRWAACARRCCWPLSQTPRGGCLSSAAVCRFHDEIMQRCATGCCTPIIASNTQRIGALCACRPLPLAQHHPPS